MNIKFKAGETYNITYQSCNKTIIRELTFEDKLETFEKGIFVFKIPFTFRQNKINVKTLGVKKNNEGRMIEVETMSAKGRIYKHPVPIGREIVNKLITTIGIAGGNIISYEKV